MQTQLKAYDNKKSVLNLLLALLILVFSFAFKRLDTWQRKACYKYKSQLLEFKKSGQNINIGDFIAYYSENFKVPFLLSDSCVLTWGLDYKNEHLDRAEIILSQYNGERTSPRRDILGKDFKEIARSFVHRITWYERKNFDFAKGEKRFAKIGLWSQQWQEAHDNVIFDFDAHRLYLRPDKGFAFKCSLKDGRTRILNATSNLPLIYNIKFEKWYLRQEKDSEEIDFDSVIKIRINNDK